MEDWFSFKVTDVLDDDIINVRADFNAVFLTLDVEQQIDALLQILTEEVDPEPEYLVLQLLVAHMLDDMKTGKLHQDNMPQGYETVLSLAPEQ